MILLKFNFAAMAQAVPVRHCTLESFKHLIHAISLSFKGQGRYPMRLENFRFVP
jgi:hypothetical protein